MAGSLSPSPPSYKAVVPSCLALAMDAPSRSPSWSRSVVGEGDPGPVRGNPGFWYFGGSLLRDARGPALLPPDTSDAPDPVPADQDPGPGSCACGSRSGSLVWGPRPCCTALCVRGPGRCRSRSGGELPFPIGPALYVAHAPPRFPLKLSPCLITYLFIYLFIYVFIYLLIHSSRLLIRPTVCAIPLYGGIIPNRTDTGGWFFDTHSSRCASTIVSSSWLVGCLVGGSISVSCGSIAVHCLVQRLNPGTSFILGSTSFPTSKSWNPRSPGGRYSYDAFWL